ncbi:uncharacterized protein EI90DRAFT_193161 [Cantharellus anzutake]|uniref:uncharacterized protein n=1 Tax=Cantharellus anzutake TaxID=1750568 RepID=UPI0019053351|nr:uncharacterized protein EI90DRAFT_193161 [Cantharellus anzutake]KAF8336576.1 hypothetical protein EI90DRAFT_193161 [Cantharellus anzutake]
MPAPPPGKVNKLLGGNDYDHKRNSMQLISIQSNALHAWVVRRTPPGAEGRACRGANQWHGLYQVVERARERISNSGLPVNAKDGREAIAGRGSDRLAEAPPMYIYIYILTGLWSPLDVRVRWLLFHNELLRESSRFHPPPPPPELRIDEAEPGWRRQRGVARASGSKQ